MIKHIVMFKLKNANGKTEYENAEEAKIRFNAVVDNVPELKSGKVVINSQKAPENNYTIALVCEFETIDDLNAYQVHPEHIKFGSFIAEVRESRACIDYEI